MTRESISRISFIGLLVLIIGLSAGMLTALRHTTTIIETRCDTLYVHDTIIHEKPVAIHTRVVDSFRVVVSDTLRMHDTLYVQIPKEEKVYQDSTYRAVVSGYLPSLDTIEVYRTDRIIELTHVVREVEKKRWGIGVQAGYGVGVHGSNVYTIPYIGVGVSYNLIRF